MKTIRIQTKKFLFFWVAACCIALLSSASIADDIKKEGAVAESAKKSKRECRTFATTGSKMRRSVCMTKEEWAVADARQKELDKEQERNMEKTFRKIRSHTGLSINGDGLDNPNTP